MRGPYRGWWGFHTCTRLLWGDRTEAGEGFTPVHVYCEGTVQRLVRVSHLYTFTVRGPYRGWWGFHTCTRLLWGTVQRLVRVSHLYTFTVRGPYRGWWGFHTCTRLLWGDRTEAGEGFTPVHVYCEGTVQRLVRVSHLYTFTVRGPYRGWWGFHTCTRLLWGDRTEAGEGFTPVHVYCEGTVQRLVRVSHLYTFTVRGPYRGWWGFHTCTRLLWGDRTEAGEGFTPVHVYCEGTVQRLVRVSHLYTFTVRGQYRGWWGFHTCTRLLWGDRTEAGEGFTPVHVYCEGTVQRLVRVSHLYTFTVRGPYRGWWGFHTCTRLLWGDRTEAGEGFTPVHVYCEGTVQKLVRVSHLYTFTVRGPYRGWWGFHTCTRLLWGDRTEAGEGFTPVHVYCEGTVQRLVRVSHLYTFTVRGPYRGWWGFHTCTRLLWGDRTEAGEGFTPVHVYCEGTVQRLVRVSHLYTFTVRGQYRGWWGFHTCTRLLWGDRTEAGEGFTPVHVYCEGTVQRLVRVSHLYTFTVRGPYRGWWGFHTCTRLLFLFKWFYSNKHWAPPGWGMH